MTTPSLPGRRHGDRLTPENAALVLLDHQTGIMLGVGDFGPTEFKNNVLALASLAHIYELPTVLTTSFETGPNGPLMPEIAAMFPEVPIVARPGQINAWDEPKFVQAVEATGRKKLIMAGVTTDVCLAFPALSATAAGYDVYAVIDASGTWNVCAQQVTVARLAQAGVVPTNWVSVSGELQADWRKPSGEKLGRLFGERLTFYGNVQSNHAARSGGSRG